MHDAADEEYGGSIGYPVEQGAMRRAYTHVRQVGVWSPCANGSVGWTRLRFQSIHGDQCMGVQRLAVGSANGSFALQVCALVGLIAWSFWPSLQGGFVWDDVAYLLPQQEPRQLTWESVRWAFSLDAAVAGH